jgi:hypothetical protein
MGVGGTRSQGTFAMYDQCGIAQFMLLMGYLNGVRPMSLPKCDGSEDYTNHGQSGEILFAQEQCNTKL